MEASRKSIGRILVAPLSTNCNADDGITTEGLRKTRLLGLSVEYALASSEPVAI